MQTILFDVSAGDSLSGTEHEWLNLKKNGSRL